MNRITIGKARKYLAKNLTLALLLTGILLPCICYSVVRIIPAKDYDHEAAKIDTIIDSYFRQTKFLEDPWFGSKNNDEFIARQWTVGISKEWENRGISFYLYQNDSMVLWSNHTFLNIFSNLSLPKSDTVYELQGQKILVRARKAENKASMALIRLWDEDNGLNPSIFGNLKVTVIPIEKAAGKNDLHPVGNKFYIQSPESEPMPLIMPICGWVGVTLILLAIERFFRRRTRIKNAFSTNFVYLGVMTLIGAIFLMFDLPTYESKVLDSVVLKYSALKISVAQLIVIFAIIQIYSIYLYRVRYKLSYRYKKLTKFQQHGLLILLLIFINLIVVFFHYTMVKIINFTNINIELYKFTLIDKSTLLFYLLGAFFVSSRILLNAFVRKVFTNRSALNIIIISLAILTLMILPIQEVVSETAYQLVIFHTSFIALAFLERKNNEYTIFISMVSMFAIYIMVFATSESNVANRKNAKDYAYKITNEQQLNDNEIEKYRKLTYLKISNHEIEVKENNSFDLQQLTGVIEKGADTIVAASGYVHYVYHFPNKNTVVVSRNEISILDYIAFFAYIFIALYLAVGFILRVADYKYFGSMKRNSLVLRIRFIVLGIVLLTMLLVMIVITINTFENYDNDQKKETNNHLQSLITSFKRYTADSVAVDNNKDSILSKWFNSNQDFTDQYLAIYNTSGDCIESTLKNTTYDKMNSNAYSALHWRGISYFNHLIEYKDRTYISAFVPIYYKNTLLGYINIIELDHVNDLAQDPRFELLTHILNILIVVVLIGVLLSMVLYRMLTRPLEKIYQGISNISRMQKIEEGNGDDEITMLVKQYNRMIDFLEESYEAIGRPEREGAWRDMARQVAHEIKNPLTPMKLKIQMLQRARTLNDKELDSKTDATLEMLLEQIDLLAKIATEFSDFARISSDLIEKFDITKLVSSVAELYSDNANVNFKYIPSIESPLMISADYSQISRVVINLCQNAMQAVSSRSDGSVTLSVKRDNQCAVITVADNGIGISKQSSKKIFQPNFTTKSSGTGLGLAMSRQIILNFNGRIFFESEEGQGATFTVRLPLDNANNLKVERAMESLKTAPQRIEE